MAKAIPIVTHGALMDFLDLLPEPELREKVAKAIRDFYRNDYPGIPTVTPTRRTRAPKKR